ncbi:rRNA maturation RNase YbeY [candidate division WOR-1 bacterium RIFOXYA12_FULL_52_29]|uniref:Endoribonuclease YbeY n=1 Tax=candidate division WOR-1 bacterium RIFOXYC12_FULL_54_18 TaxID=1802584 RepID=A0A1F4T404_UNCSA|nr:MAG: rRNA maturation RNase YbeY [candidate division WOR-1 bacterium RIFOXYA2_FULL_51_19]OGC17045.1 MAG: rRNA maturation RNase YbeY [candidate division WOR-1 bacterium RIFOXYA12_FULL_52_29]OGC25906.1 MAG: rRNA maturation RNase YbeY [candidate division WOR-1 bacterium RIFOXYB2_FULL_45_9]OGC27462.1 MAG: rRNA maturation RNase YbeY [candidate division WOR-1 bacterium RIFOXYC12_FULL_54_18]OGC29325.1 MAG: rRNA maturation RNase YbeY [candidate division WOR-1 bacterium RIFOXYB12_FULL_52_16]
MKFSALVKAIIKKEGFKGTIDVSVVDDRTIRGLNKKFRGLDKPTDVLSFQLDETGFLGDVIISEETTRKNAKRYGVSYEAEFKRLVIHGVLHILCYDHGRKMRDAEALYSQL